MAESKIAQAEAQALADVRSAAADAAVAAAETILSHTVKDKVADDLIAKGIADIKEQAQLGHFAPAFFCALSPTGKLPIFPAALNNLCKKGTDGAVPDFCHLRTIPIAR